MARNGGMEAASRGVRLEGWGVCLLSYFWFKYPATAILVFTHLVKIALSIVLRCHLQVVASVSCVALESPADVPRRGGACNGTYISLSLVFVKSHFNQVLYGSKYFISTRALFRSKQTRRYKAFVLCSMRMEG